jgi:hypothetical protein
MTIKCFQCIKDAHYMKIKWSEVKDAYVVLYGYSHCYEHLSKELDWVEKK